MTSTVSLLPEWQRIEILASCVSQSRSGTEISEDLKARLTTVQEEVAYTRQYPPWAPMIKDFHLTPIDQDILACSIAPKAEPRIGWIYQELQPGLTTHFPSLALIRELLFIEARDIPLLENRLNPDAPLVRKKLVRARQKDHFHPLRPGNRACAELLKMSRPVTAPKGAIEIAAAGTFNDLILPDASLRSLNEFLLWVTRRDTVEKEWGARIIGGPVALFSGPSGTGKTFAAEVIAVELGWPLYRVDLGLLVSKYIGETEKNLNALFDSANDRQCVLLFDEADSLFGKRGEVKEARDRYANMEVSHLLSRIERHRGPCILTTNMRRHMDTAFARRFQMVIEFPRPDADARIQLWKILMPPKVPLDTRIDFNLLGTELDLTGAQIRNICLHAAFLAAGEESVLTLNHVARAVWVEFVKEGRETMVSQLGRIGEYL